MYKNLEAEMARNSVNREDLARAINRSYSSVLGKMSGKSLFTIEEAWAIKKKLFPDCSIDYLFKPYNGEEQ